MNVVRTRGVVALLLLASLPCFAQRRSKHSGCLDTASNQAELNECASRMARKAEADLSRTDHLLLSTTSADPASLERLKATESAWTRYRDRYLEAMYPKAKSDPMSYGSSFAMNYDLLRASLTRSHIRELNELLKSMR